MDESKVPQPVLTLHIGNHLNTFYIDHHLNKGSSPPDNNNITTLPPTAITSLSHRTPTSPRFIPSLAKMKSYVYNNIPIIANNSQSPIFFNDKPTRQALWWNEDDDSDTDYDDNYSFRHLRNPPKIPGCTCQKAFQANECTILSTKSCLLSPNCSSKLFGPAPPPEHPQYKLQYDHFSVHSFPSSPVPSDPWYSECDLFCKQLMTHDILL